MTRRSRREEGRVNSNEEDSTKAMFEGIERFANEHGFRPDRIWVSPGRYLWLQERFEANVTIKNETGIPWLCQLGGIRIAASGAISDDYALIEGNEPQERLAERWADQLGGAPL